ncbi:MAG: TetR/AcrR family transcriptional regulator [Verrucomicrobiota bacterium]
MPPGRPKAFDPHEVLRAALGVFWTKGFEATSVSDLTKATGLGRQSLYNEFGDKEQLFLDAIRNYRTHETATMIEVLRGPGSTVDRVRKFFKVALDSHFDGNRRGCFLTSSIAIRSEAESEVAKLMDQFADDLREAFVRCVQEGIECGDVTTTRDPESIGMLLFTQAQGISVVGKCQRNRKLLDRSIENLLEILH